MSATGLYVAKRGAQDLERTGQGLDVLLSTDGAILNLDGAAITALVKLESERLALLDVKVGVQKLGLGR